MDKDILKKIHIFFVILCSVCIVSNIGMILFVANSLFLVVVNLIPIAINAYAVYRNWNGYQKLKEQDVKNFSKLPDVD